MTLVKESDIPGETSTVKQSQLPKATIKAVVRLMVTSVAFCLAFATVPIGQVWQLLQTVAFPWLLLALLVSVATQVVSAIRWMYIVNTLGGHLSFRSALEAHFVGLWFNQILPSGFGGDVVKAFSVKGQLGLSLSVRTVILDRISGFVLLLASIAVFIPAYESLLQDRQFTAVLAVLAFGGLGIIIVLAYSGQKIAQYPKWPRYLTHVLSLLADLPKFRKGAALSRQLLTSLIVHISGIAIYLLLGEAIGISADFMTYVLVVPLVFLISLMPISLGGWGVREVSAVWLFGIAGVTPEGGLAMSLLFGFLIIVASLPGLFYIVLLKREKQADPFAA